MNEILALAEQPLLLPFIYAAGWLGLLFLMSVFSGWRGLSERFVARGDMVGELFISVAGTMGRFRYLSPSFNSGARLVIGNEGFRLSMSAPFRPFHPALSIAWSAIVSVTPHADWRAKGVTLALRDSRIRIRIYEGAGKAILAAWDAQRNAGTSPLLSSPAARTPQPVLGFFDLISGYWRYFVPIWLLPVLALVKPFLDRLSADFGVGDAWLAGGFLAWFAVGVLLPFFLVPLSSNIPLSSNKISKGSILFWSAIAPALMLKAVRILGPLLGTSI